MDKPVMTVKEVAKYLKMHKSPVSRLVGQSKIPAFRIGADWRFNREQIDEWRLRLDRGWAQESQGADAKKATLRSVRTPTRP